MQIVSSHIRADSGTFCIFLADHYSPFYYSIIKQGIKPGSKHRFSSVHTSGRFLLSFIRKKCQQTELFIVQARPPPCQICFSKSNLINEVSTMNKVSNAFFFGKVLINGDGSDVNQIAGFHSVLIHTKGSFRLRHQSHMNALAVKNSQRMVSDFAGATPAFWIATN